MKRNLKTLGKRIGAAALAIATAFVLIPFGGKEAEAITYSREDSSVILVDENGTVFADYDYESDPHYVFDEGAVCGFYSSVSFDSVTVDASAKTVTFRNLSCQTELSTATSGWTFIFDGTNETNIVLEDGSATIQVTAGSTLTCPEIFAPAGISLGENTIMTPEDADVTDVMNAPSVVFSSNITATTTEATTETTTTEATTDDGEVSKESPADNAMPTVVSNSVEELKTLVLTDEDIAALEAGEDIKVYFAVTDIASTVDATEKTKVEEATKAASTDYSIGAYLDVDLFKQVGSKDAAAITKTNGKMKVTVTLPEALQGDYTYKVVRVHDGVATVLDTTYDATTKALTFESDQFSTYAIIYKKAEAASLTEATTAAAAATTTEATTAAKSSPKTGDSALPFVAFAILGLSALVGAYSLKKCAK